MHVQAAKARATAIAEADESSSEEESSDEEEEAVTAKKVQVSNLSGGASTCRLLVDQHAHVQVVLIPSPSAACIPLSRPLHSWIPPLLMRVKSMAYFESLPVFMPTLPVRRP